jgi:hypothetical protein
MPTYVHLLTIVHVAISLLAIVAGFVAMIRQVLDRPSRRWTFVFLWLTIATSLTGFLFPFASVTPAFLFGILSMVVLAVALFALYVRKLARPSNWIYAGTATFAFYLNFFVLVVQAFLKVPFLHTLAPNGNEPAFAIAQGVSLIGFIVLGIAAIRQSLRGATAAAVTRSA